MNSFPNTPIQIQPHDILYAQRIIKGWTQKQVAEYAGITLQQYQKLERGSRNIMTASFSLACRVIEALEIDISAFYHREYKLPEDVYIIGRKAYYRKSKDGDG